jgi:hypothetical protein
MLFCARHQFTPSLATIEEDGIRGSHSNIYIQLALIGHTEQPENSRGRIRGPFLQVVLDFCSSSRGTTVQEETRGEGLAE